MSDSSPSRSLNMASEVLSRQAAVELVSLSQTGTEETPQPLDVCTTYNAEADHSTTLSDATFVQNLHGHGIDVDNAVEASSPRYEGPTAIEVQEEAVTSNTGIASFQAIRRGSNTRNGWIAPEQPQHPSNFSNFNVPRFFPRSSWKARLGQVLRLFKRQTCFSPVGISQRMPATMISFSMAGLGVAVGHHLLNNALHGRQVEIPDWIQRFGTALAFLVTACLMWAVEIAYTQQAWVSEMLQL